MSKHTDGLARTGSGMNGSYRQARSASCRRQVGCATAALLAAVTLGPSGPAMAQQVVPGIGSSQPRQGPKVLAAEGGKLQATIQVDQVAPSQVVVPVGTSTVLDLNAPITRVEMANPEVAAVTVLSPRQILVAGQSVGTTQVILWAEGDERLVFGVAVEPNLTQLKMAIQQAAPNAKIDVRVVNDVIILTGRVHTTDEAEQIMTIANIISPQVRNQMTVAGQAQVLLRCTVAEVSRSAMRQLGVDAWASFEENAPELTAQDMTRATNALIEPIAGTSALPASSGTAFFGNRFLFGSAGSNSFQIGQSSKSLQMELFVRAMEENGLLRILAEPNLVALSGQKASFLSGGEFPVPVPQATAGGVTITIEWKDYGVKLEFVPTVVGQERVRLSVSPEVSEIDFTNAIRLEGFLIPGVTQRRAATTIELAGGSTIAIAGLLNEELRGSVTKIPGLGELPILGSLFRSVNYQQRLTELVILVTPELVTGMYPDQVPPAPARDVTVPSDWELYGLGMIEGKPIPADRSRTAALYTQPEPHYRKFTSPPEQMSLHGPWGPAEASESLP